MAAAGNTRWQLRRLGPSASCANVCDLMRLKNGNTRFGRSLDNDFYLDSKTHKNFISRHHSEIRYTNINAKPTFVLYDHGLNGTFINDVRMQKSCILKEGDKITFGHTNGFKIDPGQHSKQPNSEFQFIFEKIDDDELTDESDSSSDDSGPESDSNQQSDHFCSRNLYNSPEYDRSQCWQQGQINKNAIKKVENDADSTREFTKNENVNVRSPRGKKASSAPLADICASDKTDQTLKSGQRQNGLSVKDDHLEPPVLKNQKTLSYSDSDKSDSSSGESSDSESIVQSNKSEEEDNSSSDSEHELTIDISVKQSRTKRTTTTTKTRNAQTTRRKTVTKRSPVKAKTKTKAAGSGRVTQTIKNKTKNVKETKSSTNSHNINSPSRRLLFNKKSTTNGKSNNIKVETDPYDFNSDEEMEEVEATKSTNRNTKSSSNQSSNAIINKDLKTKNKRPATGRGKSKTAENTKRKKPPAAATKQKNKKSKVEVEGEDDEEEYGEEIWYYEGETCASDDCLKPSDSTVEWVQCDDCDQWYHTMCVGAIYAAVKDTQMEFHCGC